MMSLKDLAGTGKALVSDVLNGNRNGTDEPTSRDPSGFAAHEQIARRQNKSGRGFLYGPPLVEDVPLTDTPYAQTLTVLREFDPLAADHLHARWETQIRLSVRTLHQVRSEEETRLATQNARAASENARIDGEIERSEQACRASCASLEEQREAHAERINEAHREAAKTVAAAGGEYDPNAPSDTSVLRIVPRDLRSIAAGYGLPWVEQDHANQMGKVIGNVATVGFGALFGISLGLILNFLHSGSLLRSPVMFLICIGLGALWATLSRWFLHTTAFQASERFYLGLERRAWLPFALLTVGLFLITLGLDASVGKAGVVGLAHAKRASLLSTYRGDNRDSDGTVSILVALAFSLPYAGYAVWEGFQGGRYHPVMNRLKARQDQELKMTDAHRRSLPEVQTALHALAMVRDEQRQRADLDGRIEAVRTPYRQQTEQLRQQRVPVLDRMDEPACRRIDESILQARGLQDDWTNDLTRAIQGCAGGLR